MKYLVFFFMWLSELVGYIIYDFGYNNLIGIFRCFIGNRI